MASNTGYGISQTVRSGLKTDEYRKVQANLVGITETLRANVGAGDRLRLAMKQEGWIPPTEKPSSEDLMGIVLDKIKHNSRAYYRFMEMLDTIEGLDDTKDVIDKTKLPVEEQNNRGNSTSVDPDSYAVALDNGCIEKRRHPHTGGTNLGSSAKEEKEVYQNDDSGRESDTEVKTSPKQKKTAAKKGVEAPIVQDTKTQSKDSSGQKFEEFPIPNEPDGDVRDDLGTDETQSPYAQSASADGEVQRTVVTGLETDHQQENMLTEKVELEKRLRSKEKELDVLRNIIRRQHDQINELRQNYKELKQDKSDIDEMLKKALKDNEQAELRYASLSDEVTALKSQVCVLDRKVETLQRKCDESDERDRKRDIAEQEQRAADRAEMEKKLCKVEEKHLEELRKMEEKREQEHLDNKAMHAEIMDAFKQMKCTESRT